MSTRRWRLDIAYDGTDFSGWAEQQGLRTVQGELQLWLTRLLRLAEPARLVCAGRTDAGVHARGQVAHVDLPDPVDPEVLLRRLGRALPADVVVTSIAPAPDGFDARFAAIWRKYCYRIADGPVPPDPLLRHQISYLREPLAVEAINSAAQLLLGLRDFAPFCRRRDGATTIRTLLELSATRPAGDGSVVEVWVRADAFCHSMVRSLVGALAEVGTGRRDADWLAAVATSSTRANDVPVLPAQGLTLEAVGYPSDSELGHRVEAARQRRALPLASTPHD